MLVNATACKVASFFIGIAEVCFMSAPIGQCSYCCPRDDTVDIQYKLFTRSNPSQFQIITPDDVTGLRASGFNFASPTVIYLMGFSESTRGIGTTTVKNAFLSADDYNFIAVDWSRLIVFPWYITAVRNTRYMGLKLAEFIQFLETAGVPASTLHVIGFSLGAEAAGFAGKQLRSRGVVLGRITGLDPAYPGYGFTSNDGHLSKGDAAFVDVLHTNPVLGFPTAIGDVDFYANAGSFIQPGCWIDQVIKNRELPYIYNITTCLWSVTKTAKKSERASSIEYYAKEFDLYVVHKDGCSHVRAWRLFSESLTNPAGFPATLCRDWTSATRRCSFQTDGYMGIAASPPMAGKMYFLTNEKPPFARNGP